MSSVIYMFFIKTYEIKNIIKHKYTHISEFLFGGSAGS